MLDKKIFENKDNGLIVRLKIVPNSSKNELIFENNFIKVKVTAPPNENKANLALVDLVAKKIKVPKSNIEIIKGEHFKEKTLLIKGINEERFKSAL